MKHYSVLLVNPDTGEIDHAITSDAPITEEMLPVDLEVQHIKRQVEFDADTFVRAAEVRQELSIEGVNLADKRKPDAKIVAKTNSRLSVR